MSEEALKDLDKEGVIRIGAEVKPGDILVSVEGKPVADATEMLNLIAQLRPGQKATMNVLHKSQETSLEIVVGKRPPPKPEENQ